MPTAKAKIETAETTETTQLAQNDNPMMQDAPIELLPLGDPAAPEAPPAGSDVDKSTRKVKFRRTIGTRDCAKFGLSPARPPREGETAELPAYVCDLLAKQGLVD
jgi:hypothetical protein